MWRSVWSDKIHFIIYKFILHRACLLSLATFLLLDPIITASQFFLSQMIINSYAINHISFCAQDPTNPNLFAYITRDELTRKNYCHVFKAQSTVRYFNGYLFFLATVRCKIRFTLTLNHSNYHYLLKYWSMN